MRLLDPVTDRGGRCDPAGAGVQAHAALEDPPGEFAELRAVLLADHQWRRGAGLD